MKCPHCGWETPSSERCELCDKPLLLGARRLPQTVGARLDVVASVDRGDSLGHLLFRELWQLLEGRSTPDLALTALEQFWASLEPFLADELPRLSGHAAVLEADLRQAYGQLRAALRDWIPGQPTEAVRLDMEGLGRALARLQHSRKS